MRISEPQTVFGTHKYCCLDYEMLDIEARNFRRVRENMEFSMPEVSKVSDEDLKELGKEDVIPPSENYPAPAQYRHIYYGEEYEESVRATNKFIPDWSNVGWAKSARDSWAHGK